ncbi:hypothetical protein PN434_20770 [Microcystis aeruginosa CS-558/01A06]|uniref:Uncharacterized protein n=1 Tax=Microcystis aeruginosa BLCC-F108 TaxID=2755317 RepID=A0A841USL5_MICAE|nr:MULTISPECIES: hypothetical protein [Microcystis]MBC1191909.1 hypothetical protein [Microcystis aeruginosa BLCC-F108]MCA2589825.1 hypothetical protein [Microcystis sp. M31BS1]MDB9410908.1 hypothetical protein [Microcystis aeruginosa CS-558/01A06]
MNPSEFLSREIIRPLITLAIPGGVAIAPYVYLLHSNDTVRGFWEQHEVAMIFFLLVISLAVGLLLEDIGAEIEKFYRDQFDPTGTTWNSYLKKPAYSELKDLETPPTGIYITETAKDYINSIVLRLKFELGMFIAILFAFPGLVWIWHLNCDPINYVWLVGLPLLLSLCGYLLYEALNSVELLHETRKAILNDKRKSGIINVGAIFKAAIFGAIFGTILGAILGAGIEGIPVVIPRIFSSISFSQFGSWLQTGAVLGFLLGTTNGALFGALFGLLFGLSDPTWQPVLGPLFGAIFGLLFGAVSVLFFGAVFGLFLGLGSRGLISAVFGAFFGAFLGAVLGLCFSNNSVNKPIYVVILCLIWFSVLIFVASAFLDTRLCIINPANNTTKFFANHPIIFQGKAYGHIEKIKAKVSQNGINFPEKEKVAFPSQNKWSFDETLSNTNNSEIPYDITIDGLDKQDNLIAEGKVRVIIVDP